MHPAPQWLSSDFQAEVLKRRIFHGTLDTIPAGQRRFKTHFYLDTLCPAFPVTVPGSNLIQEIRDLLWYRFMRPGAISNNEVWLAQCAKKILRPS